MPNPRRWVDYADIAVADILSSEEMGMANDGGVQKKWNKGSLIAYLNTLYQSQSNEFLFTQSTPATVWTINHNLGFKPSVEVRDSGGSLVDCVFVHATLNQVIAYMTPAISGEARLS